MKFEKSAKKSERKNRNVDFELDLIEFNCWKRRNLTETSNWGKGKGGEKQQTSREMCESRTSLTRNLHKIK